MRPSFVSSALFSHFPHPSLRLSLRPHLTPRYAMPRLPRLFVALIAALALSLASRRDSLPHARAAAAMSAAPAAASARFVLGYTTAPDAKTARSITDVLVGERLAACVSTVPGVSSTYLWEGKVTTEQELLLVVKTRGEMVERVMKRIEEVHPYDTPEFVVTEIAAGLPKYLKWIADSTGTEGGAEDKP